MELIILALDALDDILKIEIKTYARRKEMKKCSRAISEIEKVLIKRG